MEHGLREEADLGRLALGAGSAGGEDEEARCREVPPPQGLRLGEREHGEPGLAQRGDEKVTLAPGGADDEDVGRGRQRRLPAGAPAGRARSRLLAPPGTSEPIVIR